MARLATPIERLRAALDLHDTGVALMRQNLRRAHPQADEQEIERLLQQWLTDRATRDGIDVTVDRGAFVLGSRDDAAPDLEYWLSQPVSARLAALETQRRIIYGSARATARLQRVLETAERTTG